MRLKSILFAFFITAQPVQADTVQVPKLTDGNVDLEQVLSDFSLVFPIRSSESQASDFSGNLLGEDFSGSAGEPDARGHFVIAIDAPTLSEHANFLLAVLATDAVCTRNRLRPGSVLWSETKNPKGRIWEVSTSCSLSSE